MKSKLLFMLFFGFFVGVMLGIIIGHNYTSRRAPHAELYGQKVWFFNREFLIVEDGLHSGNARLINSSGWNEEVSWETVENLLKNQSK